MKTVKMKLSELTKNPNNTRIHGEKQIAEFARSIKQFGVVRPIVADENGVILCGHGLYDALLSMGIDEVDVLVKSDLTEAQKKKLILADNKIYDMGVNDFDAIDRLMQELVGDFDIPGYDAENLELLYGKSSLADSFVVPKIEPKAVKTPENNTDGVFTPAQHEKPVTSENTASQQKRYIVCPHCGEKIEL